LEEFKNKLTTFEEKFNYFKAFLYMDSFSNKIVEEV